MKSRPRPSDDAVAMVSRLRRFLRRAPEVEFAYLFGSRARGHESRSSDLDVAVWFRKGRGRPKDRIAFVDRLGAAAGVDWPDVLALNSAPPALRYVVQRDGRLLAERAAPARMAFECRARKDYWDFQPRLEAYGQAMLGRLRNGRYGA